MSAVLQRPSNFVLIFLAVIKTGLVNNHLRPSQPTLIGNKFKSHLETVAPPSGFCTSVLAAHCPNDGSLLGQMYIDMEVR
jgi:hypothetical protein